MPLEIDEGQGEPFESSKGGRSGGVYYGGPGIGGARGGGAGSGGYAGSLSPYHPGGLFGMRRRFPMAGQANWSGQGGIGGSAPVMAGGFSRGATPTGGYNPGASYGPVGLAGGEGGGMPARGAMPAGGGWQGRFRSMLGGPQFERFRPGGQFNPQDPYGAFTGNPDPGFIGEFHRGFGQFGEQGAYGPEGNQRLFDRIREQLISGQGDTERRGQLANQMDFAGDPSRYGFANLQSALKGGSDLSRGLGDAALQFGMRQDEFGKQLYQKWLDYQLGRAQSLQRGIPGQGQQQGGGLGGLLGGIAGTIGGSFFGAPQLGGALGSGIGGRL